MDQNRFWMGVCAYHEAKGEPLQGKIAVCQVILNRAVERKLTAKEVIFEPYQFSWVKNLPPMPRNRKDYDALAQSFSAVEVAIDQRINGDNFHGANHFHANYVNPKWADKSKIVDIIGITIFYRL